MKSRFLIGVAVSVVLLGLLLWQIPLADLGRSFAEASIPGLLLTVAIHAAVLSLKVARWNIVLSALPATAKRPRWLTFDALFLGYFGNYALPAKLGEVGRSILYSRGSSLPFSSVFATIVFERFLDALVLVAGFYAVVLLIGLPVPMPGWVNLSLQVAASVTMLGLLGLYLFWKHLPAADTAPSDTAPNDNTPGSVAPSAVAKILQRATEAAIGFRSGLAILERPLIGLHALAWTALIWSVEASSVWICLQAFGVDIHWSAPILQMVVTSFAIATPSAPGGVGIHQWATVLVLAPYGVAEADAVASSVVLTLAVVFWVVPLGLYGLWRQGYSTAELQADYEAISSS